MTRVRQQGDLRPMGNDKAAMAELITILSSRETALLPRRWRSSTRPGRGVDEASRCPGRNHPVLRRADRAGDHGLGLIALWRPRAAVQ